ADQTVSLWGALTRTASTTSAPRKIARRANPTIRTRIGTLGALTAASEAPPPWVLESVRPGVMGNSHRPRHRSGPGPSLLRLIMVIPWVLRTYHFARRPA